MKPKAVVLKCGSVVVLDPVAKMLKIHEEDGRDGVYIPPRVVRVCGEKDLRQLRDLLNEVYPPEELQRLAGIEQALRDFPGDMHSGVGAKAVFDWLESTTGYKERLD